MRVIYIIIVATIILNACDSSSKKVLDVYEGEGFSIERKNDTLSYIVLQTDSLIDRWELPYPVYQFQIGDIDGNGVEDAMVGVVKTTRFDSTLAKRIFIFKNYKGYVRPMWLGSKLSKPLVDFCFYEVDDEPRLRSIEQEKKTKYLVAEYKWRKFGLEFIQYIEKGISLKQAQNILIK